MVLKELISKFLCWEGVVVLKKLIFINFYCCEGCGGPKKNSLLTVSTLGSCGRLKRTDF